VKVLLRLLNVLYQEALKFQGIFFQVSWIRRIAIFVVATTCQNGTCYTDFGKALSRLSSSGNYKRTQQGALAALLLYLYKYNVVHATTISTGPYVHASTSCPITKATIPYTCALTSYS